MFSFIKKFIFATYESDKQLFKMRNRILLCLALYAGFELVYPNPAINLSAAEQQDKIIIEETQNGNIKQEKVSIEEIKYILNKSSNFNIKEAAIVKNDFKENLKTDKYIILLLTTKKSENTDSFKEKYSTIDIKEVITASGDKLLYIGPYEGFSLAKKQLIEQKDSLPADSYVVKYVY